MLNTDWSLFDGRATALGRFGEFYAKSCLTSYGLDVYSAEVDDHGVDLLVRRGDGRSLALQVKTVRAARMSYVGLRRAHFDPAQEGMLLLLQLLWDGSAPALYLIPAAAWRTPGGPFVAHGTYDPPELGLNLSHKALPALEPYRFEKMVDALR